LSLRYVLRTKEKNFSIVINYGMANMFNIQFIAITRLILESYKFQISNRFKKKLKYAIRYKGNPLYNLNMNSKVQNKPSITRRYELWEQNKPSIT
jgi:hypothetical protein